MGGVNEMIFGTGAEKKIGELASEEIKNNKEIPYILAPYCSVSIHTSDAELKAFRNSVNL